MVVLGAPMLLLVSAMMASQWDEFSHWLPSARYLYVTDGFPDGRDPVTGASFPAYPYGWPLATYFASRLSGRFVEIAGALTNVAMRSDKTDASFEAMIYAGTAIINSR